MGESFEYVVPDASNYLSDSTSVKNALGILDGKIKENETTALSSGEIEAVCTL